MIHGQCTAVSRSFPEAAVDSAVGEQESEPVVLEPRDA